MVRRSDLRAIFCVSAGAAGIVGYAAVMVRMLYKYTDRYARWRARRVMSEDPAWDAMSKAALGSAGERLAAAVLTLRGRRILYRNYRGPSRGEIDLVTRDGEVLAFVEVKTRREGGSGRPLDAVNAKKRELMRRGGKAWLRELKLPDVNWRYDVVEIIVAEGVEPKVNVVNDIETRLRREGKDASDVGEVRASGKFEEFPL